MTEYNGSISNLLQGVSQQPRSERRPEQLEAQVNCISSVTEGLGKRQGTSILTSGSLTDYPSNAAYYTYDRGDGLERYSIVVKSGVIKVTDLLTGLDKTVDLNGHSAYITSTAPNNDFRFHTVADTTFIVNKSKVPLMETPTASSSIWQAMIYVKRVSWGFAYEVISDGTVIASATTPPTITLGSTEQSKNITLKTTDLIDCLWTGDRVGNATWVTGYTGGVDAWATANSVTAAKFEDVIYLSHATLDKKIEVKDANHGNDMVTFGQTIDTYTGLPRMAYNGYKVKITGVDKTVYNDYYVTFEAENGSGIGYGTWKESAGFGVDTEFDASTMPHILTREADGSFLLQEVPWVARQAGDDDTNPKPSFVGVGITDLLTYQGRLVFLTEENVVASVTFDQYNLFAETVTQESDADPIDTASSDKQVTNLQHGLVFNASLVLFSDRAQFVHPADTVFSTGTFGLSSKSRFNNIVGCEPVASASSIFSAYESGRYTGIREIQVENVTGNLLADDIARHVDHYMPGSAKQLEASTDYSILVVRPGTDTTALYVFQWFSKDGSRAQAAWHKWEFDREILHISILDNRLYMWRVINSVVSVEYIDLSNTDTEGCSFPVRLDCSDIVTGTDDGLYWKVDVTQWVTTRGISRSDLKVIAGNDTGIEGALSEYIEHPTDANAFRVPKVAVFPTGTPDFIVGCTIESEGEITSPFVRSNDGKPKTKGKLRLGRIKFNCSDTGELNIVIEKQDSATYTKEFNSRLIDNINFNLDEPPVFTDAEITAPIRSDANRCSIKFQSDSHLPFNISSIDWTGSYYETGRRTV